MGSSFYAISMSSSMSLHGRLEQEEPEYKRLFQEIFDLIHTVVPVNKSWNIFSFRGTYRYNAIANEPLAYYPHWQ